MSFKRPKVPKPKIPKLKKPTSSAGKKLSMKEKPKVMKKNLSKNTKKKKIVSKQSKTTARKKTHKKTGICYSKKDCKGEILASKCTKSACKKIGGKSWKETSKCQPI